jgi:hypothetical protein
MTAPDDRAGRRGVAGREAPAVRAYRGTASAASATQMRSRPERLAA